MTGESSDIVARLQQWTFFPGAVLGGQDMLARLTETGVTYIVGAWELIRAKGYYHVDWMKQYPVVDRIGYSVLVFKVP